MTKDPQETKKHAHFEGKDAAHHVAKIQADGIFTSSEAHGIDPPGHLAAAADAAREAAVFLLLVFISLQCVPFEIVSTLKILATLLVGWMFWKGGRAGWLAWSRLERMHRIVDQERWEITHHREQEREELVELYRLKGLKGKLLEDVVDVFMADESRLLRVMVEEELCLKIHSQEHPLKQGFGATCGAFFAGIFCLAALLAFPPTGIWVGSFLVIGAAGALSSYFQGNELIPGIVWNLGIAGLAVGVTFFLFTWIQ